jgi:hypothetical protein
VDFVSQIQPLLVSRCSKCHGEEKAMGKLRLHSAEAIQAFHEKDLVVAGKPDESVLLKRITLPADDKKRMPKGGDPLPQAEIDLVRQWIAEGAVYVAASAPAPPADLPATTEKPADEPAEHPLPEAPPASPEAIAAVEKTGGSAMPLFQGSPLLQVSFARLDPPAGDAALASLAGVAEQVAWLDLNGAQASDWSPLAKLKNLSRLHLEHSSATDATLAHVAGLTRLEYLNVFGTAITDAGLEHLKSVKSLRRLYVWQTKVSFEAAEALKAAVPGLAIELGWDHPAVVKQRTEAELAAVKKQGEEANKRVEDLQKQLDEAKKEKEQSDARAAELQKQLDALAAPPAAGDAAPAEPTAEAAAEAAAPAK